MNGALGDNATASAIVDCAKLYMRCGSRANRMRPQYRRLPSTTISLPTQQMTGTMVPPFHAYSARICWPPASLNQRTFQSSNSRSRTRVTPGGITGGSSTPST